MSSQIAIHEGNAVIPKAVITEKWGFIPSEAHMRESEEMQDCVRTLIQLLTEQTIPHPTTWNTIAVDDDSVLIFW